MTYECECVNQRFCTLQCDFSGNGAKYDRIYFGSLIGVKIVDIEQR